MHKRVIMECQDKMEDIYVNKFANGKVELGPFSAKVLN